jgi:hypothetical protein
VKIRVNKGKQKVNNSDVLLRLGRLDSGGKGE